MPNRKENISRIADGCSISPWNTSAKVSVFYADKYFAVYDVSGERPKYRENFVSPNRTAATNQYIIDGMRLAAQRVIDKRKPKAVNLKDAVDKMFADMAANGISITHIGHDIAKSGSDRSVLFPHQRMFFDTSLGKTRRPGFEPNWIVFDEATTLTAAGRAKLDALRPYSDVAGDEIARLAKLPLASLAVEYRRYVELAAKNKLPGADHQDYADLIDDIACMRFGVGFYAPGKEF